MRMNKTMRVILVGILVLGFILPSLADTVTTSMAAPLPTTANSAVVAAAPTLAASVSSTAVSPATTTDPVVSPANDAFQPGITAASEEADDMDDDSAEDPSLDTDDDDDSAEMAVEASDPTLKNSVEKTNKVTVEDSEESDDDAE